MKPLATDIGALLNDAGLGTTGDDLFIGFEPDGADIPDNCITVYDTGGGEQDPANAIDNSTVQVRVRNKNYENGFNKINDIKKYIEGKGEVVVNNTTYVGFWTRTNIAHISRDAKNRNIWTVNFRVTRTPSNADKGNRN